MAASGNQSEEVIPETNVLAPEVSETDEIIPGVPEKDVFAPELSESEEITRGMSETSEATREEINESGAIHETSQSGAISRTIYHFRYGHIVSFKFSVLNLSEKKSIGFQAGFEIDCHAGPTSWLCEMVFERVSDDDTSCIIFKLMRSDSARDKVELNASLEVKDVTTKNLFYSPSIYRLRVSSGELIEADLIRKFRTPEEVSHFNSKLDVLIDIRVCYCHLEKDLEGECLIF